jgi:D-Tyr-tRNAtyr deacylase
MAIYANLSIDQGSDFTEELKVRDAAGSIVSLSGYTVKGEIRRHPSSTTKYDFACTITSQALGLINIHLSSTTSNSMKPGRYQYDVEVKKTSTGVVTRIVEGQIEVTAGITRSI